MLGSNMFQIKREYHLAGTMYSHNPLFSTSGCSKSYYLIFQSTIQRLLGAVVQHSTQTLGSRWMESRFTNSQGRIILLQGVDIPQVDGPNVV